MTRTSACGWHALRALRHRNYRLFFAGQLVSVTGTWMQQVALGWLVLELTGDPFLLGIVAAAQFTPVVLFGLVGGLVADRASKRLVLAVAQIVEMILAFILFALTASGQVEVWQLIVLGAALGTAYSIEWPARHAFVVEMVGRDDLVNAIGINSITFNTARVIGPAIAGFVIGLVGTELTFLINAVSFIPVTIALFAMRDSEMRQPPSTRPRPATSTRSNLASGPRFVAQNPVVLMAMLVVGVVATFGMNFTVVIPPLARDVLGTDATGYGFLMAASGLGSLAAGIGVAFARHVDPRAVAVSAGVLGVATIALALSRSFGLSLAIMAVAGASAIAMAAIGNTVVQLLAPDELRGRVMSVWTIVFSASAPAGGLIIGWLASSASVPVAIGLGGVASVLVSIAALVWHRGRQPTPGPVHEPPPGAVAGPSESS